MAAVVVAGRAVRAGRTPDAHAPTEPLSSGRCGTFERHVRGCTAIPVARVMVAVWARALSQGCGRMVLGGSCARRATIVEALSLAPRWAAHCQRLPVARARVCVWRGVGAAGRLYSASYTGRGGGHEKE